MFLSFEHKNTKKFKPAKTILYQPPRNIHKTPNFIDEFASPTAALQPPAVNIMK